MLFNRLLLCSNIQTESTQVSLYSAMGLSVSHRCVLAFPLSLRRNASTASQRTAGSHFLPCAQVWDVANNQLLGELLTHSEAVTCFAFEGYFVFSGSEDCRVCVWDLQTVAAGRRRHTLDLEAADPKGAKFAVQPAVQ